MRYVSREGGRGRGEGGRREREKGERGKGGGKGIWNIERFLIIFFLAKNIPLIKELWLIVCERWGQKKLLLMY